MTSDFLEDLKLSKHTSIVYKTNQGYDYKKMPCHRTLQLARKIPFFFTENKEIRIKATVHISSDTYSTMFFCQCAVSQVKLTPFILPAFSTQP
jgi:hypothetical protein